MCPIPRPLKSFILLYLGLQSHLVIVNVTGGLGLQHRVEKQKEREAIGNRTGPVVYP